MLHVTNGSSVSLADTGLGGDILVWRDSLHGEGEPPALPASEIVLWFEHDLYDQAQLIEILARLNGRHDVELICTDRYLGPLTGEQLRELWPLRHPVTASEYVLGTAAWTAFRSGDPAAIETLLAQDTSALPFLAGALHRYLQQLPWINDGLARTERQILEIALEGGHTFRTLFPAEQKREERIFLGDDRVRAFIRGLLECRTPLLAEEGEVYRVTDAGRAVLAGRADHVALNGTEGPWRWNEATGKLQRPELHR
jgi:hypothetical protein